MQLHRLVKESYAQTTQWELSWDFHFYLKIKQVGWKFRMEDKDNFYSTGVYISGKIVVIILFV